MNIAEINWDLENSGNWPLPIKIGAGVLACGLIIGGWVYMDTLDQLDELEQVEKKELDLKRSFEIKQRKSIHLEDYKQQLKEMNISFGAMLKQLPNSTEVASLLVDVSQTGLASGLEFELFQPQGEVKREFYAELPINIRVVGDYMAFADFVSGLASLPRIVTIHNIKISGGKGGSVMNALVKTYRYLDESEYTAPVKKKGRRRR